MIPAPKQPTKQQKNIIKAQRRKALDSMARELRKNVPRQVPGTPSAGGRRIKPKPSKVSLSHLWENRVLTYMSDFAQAHIDMEQWVRTPWVTVQASSYFSASTNMRDVSILLDDIPSFAAGVDECSRFFSAVKGVLHHELGHIVHTIPLEQLAPVGSSYTHYETTWNILEDQRMEAARVRDFPACKRYFTSMIHRYLLSPDDDDLTEKWVLLAGRHYLPDEWRAASRALFPHDPDEWAALVQDYMSATTTEDMWSAVLQAHKWLLRLRGPVRQLDKGVVDRSSEAGGGVSGSGVDDRAKGSATNPGSDKPGVTDRRVAGELSPEEEFKMALDNAEAPDEKFAVHSVGKEFRDGRLPDLIEQTREMSSKETDATNVTHQRLRFEFEKYFTAATPRWTDRTEDGIIVPLDYRTRDYGETDYHRQFEGEVNDNKLDTKVSILADVSGSMASSMSHLSVCLTAFKLTFDDLGIESQFTLWSDHENTYRVFHRQGHEYRVFPTLGGTEPTRALDDALLADDTSSTNHLIVVLTDGAWAGVDDIGPWRSPDQNQHFMLVRMGSSMNKSDKGFDSFFTVNDLEDFPRMVGSSLSSMLDGRVS